MRWPWLSTVYNLAEGAANFAVRAKGNQETNCDVRVFLWNCAFTFQPFFKVRSKR